MRSGTEPPTEGSETRSTPSATGERWVESRAGGLFFLNAILVAPAAMVAVPVLMALLLRAFGVAEGLQLQLDTVPLVAAHVAPYLGWLAAPAAWFAWRTRRETDRTGPRTWLLVFVAVHLVVLAYTVWRWIGGGG